jgi:DNA-directed RNA polymerase subunit alpha
VPNALRSRHIDRVGQVLDMEPEQLLSIRNFGPRSLQELKERMGEYGYHFEMPNVDGAIDTDDDAIEDDDDDDSGSVAE